MCRTLRTFLKSLKCDIYGFLQDMVSFILLLEMATVQSAKLVSSSACYFLIVLESPGLSLSLVILKIMICISTVTS